MCVYANMVKWYTIRYRRWHHYWNIQKVRPLNWLKISFVTDLMCIMYSFSDLIKDQARPTYWVPDHQATNCCICELPFGTAEELVTASAMRTSTESDGRNSQPREIRAAAAVSVSDRRRHHCRSCGQGVCDNCSEGRHPVPERGWPTEVRVCDDCYKKLTTEWKCKFAYGLINRTESWYDVNDLDS